MLFLGCHLCVRLKLPNDDLWIRGSKPKEISLEINRLECCNQQILEHYIHGIFYYDQIEINYINKEKQYKQKRT